MVDGLVIRYPTHSGSDELPASEGAFLVCSFWLANSLALIGRHPEAVALFQRLLALRNDLGLLAEEYDPRAKRFLGNFPQAFSHIGIINTAAHLAQAEPASVDRGADKATETKPATRDAEVQRNGRQTHSQAIDPRSGGRYTAAAPSEAR